MTWIFDLAKYLPESWDDFISIFLLNFFHSLSLLLHYVFTQASRGYETMMYAGHQIMRNWGRKSNGISDLDGLPMMDLKKDYHFFSIRPFSQHPPRQRSGFPFEFNLGRCFAWDLM